MRLLFYSLIIFSLVVIQTASAPWKHKSNKFGRKNHKKYTKSKHLERNQRWTKNGAGSISKTPKHHPKPHPKPHPQPQPHSSSGEHPNVNHGTATWFNQDSQGSCGWWKSDDDFIAALPQCINADQYCGKKVSITYKGKTITVEAVDTCPECDSKHLDLSTGAFNALTGDLELGLVDIQWYFI